MKKLFRYLLYILPLVLCFSYYPLIKLGENETMYFELSLPLLFLVVFDIVGLFLTVKKYREKLFKMILGSIWWWMFPFFVSFSAIWSLNPLRALLTVGVMWLLVFAVVFIYLLREYLDSKFWVVFLRWFFASTLLVCFWCILQCILDVSGVSQDVSLLCDGCVSRMFGFPHPNGFAIEPQFMGNLLLAPINVVVWMIINNTCNTSGASLWCNQRLYTKASPLRRKNHRFFLDVPQYLQVLLFILSCTLFLTMSRGAIYACVVGLCFLFSFMYFRAKKTDRKKVCFSILKSIGVFIVAFLFTLNLQGILASVSPTQDTYGTGVAKVLNQLSLGVIDVRDETEKKTEKSSDKEGASVENSEKTEGKTDGAENGVVENSGNTTTKAVFDGYVAESTDTRIRLSNAALTVWRKDFKTVMVGVGIGGAGQALFDNGFSPAPREIVQNEYVSLLLETGLIGVFLFVAMMILVIRVFLRNKNAGMLLALLVAYGVSLLFFSGLTNALQIVLLPGILYHLDRAFGLSDKNKAKK